MRFFVQLSGQKSFHTYFYALMTRAEWIQWPNQRLSKQFNDDSAFSAYPPKKIPLSQREGPIGHVLQIQFLQGDVDKPEVNS